MYEQDRVELIINGHFNAHPMRFRYMAPTDALTPTVGGSPDFLTPPEVFVLFINDDKFFPRPYSDLILYYI